MVTSVGIDIVEKGRIKSAYKRFGERFLKRILSPEEINIFTTQQHRMAFLAGRFAIKEAVIKALGEYLDERPPFNVIQVVNENDNQLSISVPDYISSRISRVRLLVSMSQSLSNAMAMVIFEEDK